MLADRVKTLKPSPTLAVSAKANELKAKGIDIISFGAGEPDIDTPDFVKEACIKALKEGKTKYTPSSGILPLREALVDKLKNENNVEYSPSEIVVSTGAKMVLFLIFMAMLNEGDEVIIPSPYWVTYPEQIRLFGGVPVFAELQEDNNFELTLDILKEYVSPKTKILIINSPSNPTGAVISEENLQKIVEFCIEKNIFIISDECYEHFVYDGAYMVSPASFSKEAREITFTVNAFSKTFSMTGWRVGYVACPSSYAKIIADLNSQSVSNVTSFAQWGALEALKNDNSKAFIENMKNTFSKRRSHLINILENYHIPYSKPKGAFYMFIDLTKYKDRFKDDIEMSSYILEKGNVALVPGSSFGKDFWARLSYCVSEDTLSEGVKRINEALKSL